jgi:hypothetical protein
MNHGRRHMHCATSDEITRAKQVLEQTGAQDVSASGEKREDAADVAPVLADRTRL